MLRNTAATMLALAWLFPLLAVALGTLLPPAYAPALAPGAGVSGSDRTFLFLLCSSAFLLSCPRAKMTIDALGGCAIAFLTWAIVSSLNGRETFNSLLFALTWFSAASAFVATRRLLPSKPRFDLRASMIHLPTIIVAASAILPVATGASQQVSEPFQLSNVYSNWLLMLLPLVLLDLFAQQGRRSLLCLTSSTLCLASLALTYSRTSWILTLLEISVVLTLLSAPPKKRLLGWAAGIGVGFCLLIAIRSEFDGMTFLAAIGLLFLTPPVAESGLFKRDASTLVKLGLLAVAAWACVFAATRGNSELDLVGKASLRLNRFVQGDTSTQSRTEFWKAAVEIANDNPIFGTGPATFADVYPQYQHSYHFYSDSPHATTLELVSELGWVGGVLFISMLIALLAKARRHWNNTPREQMAAVGFCFGLIHAQTDVTYQFSSCWVTLAIVGALMLPRSEDNDTPPRVPPAYFALILAPLLIWLMSQQRQLELAKHSQDEQEVLRISSRVSANLPAWSLPSILALRSGLYLAQMEPDSAARERKLKELTPFSERALRYAPMNASSHRFAGIQARLMGEPSLAKRELERSLALDPCNYPETYLQLYRVVLAQGDPAESVRLGKEILTKFPIEALDSAHTSHRDELVEQLVPLFSEVADNLSPYSFPLETEPIYRFLVKEAPSARALHGLGVSLFTQNRLDEAIPFLEEAHRLNPIFPVPSKGPSQ